MSTVALVCGALMAVIANGHAQCFLKTFKLDPSKNLAESRTCLDIDWEKKCTPNCEWKEQCLSESASGEPLFYVKDHRFKNGDYQLYCCQFSSSSNVSKCQSFAVAVGDRRRPISIKQTQSIKPESYRLPANIQLQSNERRNQIVVNVCTIRQNARLETCGSEPQRQQQQKDDKNAQNQNRNQQQQEVNKINQNDRPRNQQDANSLPKDQLNGRKPLDANSVQKTALDEEARVVQDILSVRKEPDAELNPATIQKLFEQGIDVNSLDLQTVGDLEAVSYEALMNRLKFSEFGLLCAVGCSVGGAVGAAIGLFALAAALSCERFTVEGANIVYSSTELLIPNEGTATVTCQQPNYSAAGAVQVTIVTCTASVWDPQPDALEINCVVVCQNTIVADPAATYPNAINTEYTQVSKTALVACTDSDYTFTALLDGNGVYYEADVLPTCQANNQWAPSNTFECVQTGCLSVIDGDDTTTTFPEAETVDGTDLTPAGKEANVACTDTAYTTELLFDGTTYYQADVQPVCQNDQSWLPVELSCIKTCLNSALVVTGGSAQFPNAELTDYTPHTKTADVLCNDFPKEWLVDSENTVFEEAQVDTCGEVADNTWKGATWSCVTGCKQTLVLTPPDATVAAAIDYDNDDEDTLITPVGQTAGLTCTKADTEFLLYDSLGDKYEDNGHTPVCLDDKSWDAPSYDCVVACTNADLLKDETKVGVSITFANEFIPLGKTAAGRNATIACGQDEFIALRTPGDAITGSDIRCSPEQAPCGEDGQWVYDKNSDDNDGQVECFHYSNLCQSIKRQSYTETTDGFTLEDRYRDNGAVTVLPPTQLANGQWGCMWAIAKPTTAKDSSTAVYRMLQDEPGLPSCETLVTRTIPSCIDYEFVESDEMFLALNNPVQKQVWRDVYKNSDQDWVQFDSSGQVVRTFDFTNDGDLALWENGIAPAAGTVCARMVPKGSGQFKYRGFDATKCDTQTSNRFCMAIFPTYDMGPQ